jgi:glycerol uptake facilitator-like aquaporin
MTNTFAGIRPVDVAGFLLSQIAGAFAATWLFRWLQSKEPDEIASSLN